MGKDDEADAAVIYQNPPWLDAMVDQRMAMLAEMVSEEEAAVFDIITFQLTDPPSPEGAERWEETCDGCSTYVPGELYNAVVIRRHGGTLVHVMFGVCNDCREKVIEHGEHHPGRGAE